MISIRICRAFAYNLTTRVFFSKLTFIKWRLFQLLNLVNLKSVASYFMYHCNMSPAVNQIKIKLDVKLIGMILLFCKSPPSWMTLSCAAVVTRQYIFPIFDWLVIRWLRLCWNIPFIHCFSASSVYHFYKYLDLYLEFLGEVVLICVVEISISCNL